MNKIIILYIFLASTVSAQGLLRCLGKEEAQYAKLKYTGPNYKLNQIMIEEIISLSDLKILPSAYRKICSNYKSYPSLLLLEELLKERSKIFYSAMSPAEEAIYKSLRSKVGKILIRYLSYLQSLARKPNCFEKEIPQINSLFSRYRYLEDVIGHKQVLGEEKGLLEIVNKLKSSEEILKNCQ